MADVTKFWVDGSPLWSDAMGGDVKWWYEGVPDLGAIEEGELGERHTAACLGSHAGASWVTP